ncbi:MAG TPA: hypothetical protein DEW46_08750, partial [Verrucomicrobia bacterium]|nr:hypothetical protein [Verrucomicrobiota bacterium]
MAVEQGFDGCAGFRGAFCEALIEPTEAVALVFPALGAFDIDGGEEHEPAGAIGCEAFVVEDVSAERAEGGFIREHSMLDAEGAQCGDARVAGCLFLELFEEAHGVAPPHRIGHETPLPLRRQVADVSGCVIGLAVSGDGADGGDPACEMRIRLGIIVPGAVDVDAAIGECESGEAGQERYAACGLFGELVIDAVRARVRLRLEGEFGCGRGDEGRAVVIGLSEGLGRRVGCAGGAGEQQQAERERWADACGAYAGAVESGGYLGHGAIHLV